MLRYKRILAVPPSSPAPEERFFLSANTGVISQPKLRPAAPCTPLFPPHCTAGSYLHIGSLAERQTTFRMPLPYLQTRCGPGAEMAWGIPSQQKHGTTKKASKWARPDLGKRAAPYLHTFIPMGNEKKEILIFCMVSIGILVCRYGLR